MPMLATPLALWDVRDLEAHMNTVSTDGLRILHVNYLATDKRESLLAYLIAWAWQTSGLADDCRTKRPDVAAYITTHGRHPPAIYDPRSGWSFSKWTWQWGCRRVIDWYRSPAEGFHDLRSPKPALPLSLDGPATDAADGPGLSLIETLADQASPSDPTAQLDSDSLVGRIHASRHRYPTGTDALLGRRLQSGTRTTPDEPDDRRHLSEVRGDPNRARTTPRAA